MYYFRHNYAMSLRKEKAARLKLSILEHTLKLIGRRPFEDLFVEDICQRVKISKVTLFKYFPVKEDILAYYFRVWCLRRTVELKDKPKEGLQGIQYVFDKLSEDFDQNPGIILSLVAYLSSPKRPPKPVPGLKPPVGGKPAAAKGPASKPAAAPTKPAPASAR